ncbi:hypothetical protein M8J75_012476 [Diaphorina citri]|nr:hypothetical protein M8J75_012476 [Diaphorina citri]
MAVPSDLINAVLKDYYAKKESKPAENNERFDAYTFKDTCSKSHEVKPSSSSSEAKSSSSAAKPSSAKNDDTEPKAKTYGQQYDDYEKESYNYNEDAYYGEMYPEYEDLYYAGYAPPEPPVYGPPKVPPVYGHPEVPPVYGPPLRPPHLLPPVGYRPRPYGMLGAPRPPPPHYYGTGPPRFPPRHRPPLPHTSRNKSESARPSRPHFQEHEPYDGYLKRRHDDDDDDDDNSQYDSKRRNTGFHYIEELFDYDALPRGLTELFTRDTCNLCLVSIKQPGMMRLHYQGKSHVKRMKGWMYKTKHEHRMSVDQIESICEPNDIGAPSAAEVVEPGPVSAPSEDKNLDDQDLTYCHLCNVPISSPVVAKQHYTGKRHQKALANRQGENVPAKSKDSDASADSGQATQDSKKWFCHVCNVNSASEDQYEVHLSGKRHKKAWKVTQMVAPVGLESIIQSSHQGIKVDVDPELLLDYDLDLFCPRCKEYFTAPPELTYHSCSNQTIKADELFCKKCKTGFDTRPELKYHDCRQDHYCRECDKCFDSPNELMKHECGQKQNGKEKKLKSNLSQDCSYYCTLCRKTLNSAISLETHGKSRLHNALLHKLIDKYEVGSDFNPFRTIPREVFHCDQCTIHFKDEEELALHKKQGHHSIPRSTTKLSNAEPAKVTQPSPEKEIGEVGEYDIRNVDVNALLKQYNKS